MNEPLAIKLKPKTLKDVLGQETLIGKDKIISNMVKNKKIFSMILYGEPGIGKTSIATAIVNDLGMNYRFLNAVIHKKQDFDIVIEEAKMYDGMILIVDEIHRLNKDKQDILLPCLESGLITLIGLTTSNPYHAINPAIRSRCQIFKLEPLSEEDILKGLKKAIKTEYLKDIKITNDALKYIAKISKYDLRFAYNLLEVSYYYNKDHSVSVDTIKSINNTSVITGDKNEESYYNSLSGLQKSIRGSDVNAALHYLAQLLIMEDLSIIFRRLCVICYEDIGLGNPSIGPKLNAVIDACERVGLPEARIPLSNIVIEMCLSPKSNSAYLAIDKAINEIKEHAIGEVPSIIKSPNIGYLYPHNYPNSLVKQNYMPDKIKDSIYYYPKETSKYEKSLKEVYEKINKIIK